ncbi:DUF4913 domain-containing protein [Actinoplanes sp. NPDC051343]|uniref:DUF4913 domain-containing protein n=1 Tax=Actinoplanes sp. NPDC051343 TaxID=3363906 RepID=UPI003799C92C
MEDQETHQQQAVAGPATAVKDTGDEARTEAEAAPEKARASSPFIVYMQQPQFSEELALLAMWVHQLLLPIYAEEATSGRPWCPQWWQHAAAVAHLHGLWLAWQDLTGADATLAGPATWHRDFLAPTMTTLRAPDGPFAGCKAGMHRDKDVPFAEQYVVAE